MRFFLLPKLILTMIVAFAVIVATFVRGMSYVSAQDSSGTICYGWASLDPDNERIVEATVNNASHAQEWVFDGQSDTYATIRMIVTEGSLDPLVIVVDETTGERLASASANDSAGRRIVNIQNLRLPSNGEYTITATRLGEANGTTEGSYTLSLEPGISNILPQVQLHTLMFDGEVMRNQFAAAGDTHVRYFEGQIGQQLTVAAHLTDLSSGTIILEITALPGSGLNVREGPGTSFSVIGDPLSPGDRVEQLEEDQDWYRVRLEDGSVGWISGQFAEVVQSSALQLFLYIFSDQEWQLVTKSNQSNDVRITNHLLSQDGSYAVALESAGNLVNYELTLAGAGGTRPILPRCAALLASCPAASPTGQEAKSIIDGESVSGTISAASPLNMFQFQAFEGDSISVDMQRTSGDLNTFIGLSDVDGNILARDTSTEENTSSIADFTIPTDGCYYIYATRKGGSETEGNFALVVTGIPEIIERIPEPPSEVSFGGDVVLGETITGEISSEVPQIVYRITVRQAVLITLNATRDSGDLAPAIQVLDERNNQVTFASANLFGDASNPLTFDTEAGNYYFIVVQREGGVEGTTTGVFTLTIEN